MKPPLRKKMILRHDIADLHVITSDYFTNGEFVLRTTKSPHTAAMVLHT